MTAPSQHPQPKNCKYAYPIYQKWFNPVVIGIRCQGVKRSQMDTCESIIEKGLCPTKQLRQQHKEQPMTAPSQHPQRCETCVWRCRDDGSCIAPIDERLKRDCELSETMKNMHPLAFLPDYELFLEMGYD